MHSENNKYQLCDEYPTNIEVGVSNPMEIKSSLLSFTVYTVKGTDKKGEFLCMRRYSQFDLVRQILLKRWPGCYIPALPEKKLVGNNESNFVENRKRGLEVFCKQMAQLPYLWYSQEFDIFLRKQGNTIDNLKGLSKETHQDIIKKYDERLTHLRGKSIDAHIISKVLEFSKSLRKIQPIITDFKEFLGNFLEAKNNNYEQYSVLFNSLLPEYQKICLTSFLQQKTDGKLIFSQQTDEKLADFTKRFKQLATLHNFEQLFLQITHQQRELDAFFDTYKEYEQYQKKIRELRDRQKSLKLSQQNLLMGKQDIISSILNKDIEQSKKQIQHELKKYQNLITTYTLISDLIMIVMGVFEIDRFRKEKLRIHHMTIMEIARGQAEVAKLQKDMYNHILDNHNLM